MTNTGDSMPKYYFCFICGQILSIKIDKQKKPYLICNECGVQSFIRGTKGLEKLIEFNNDPDFLNKIASKIKVRTQEILFLITQIKTIENQINNLEEFDEIHGSIFNSKVEDQVDSLFSKLEVTNKKLSTLLGSW